MYYILYITLIIFLNIIQNIKRKEKGFIYSITAGGGLGNKIAAIPGTYLLSLLSNRKFHSIIIYNY